MYRKFLKGDVRYSIYNNDRNDIPVHERSLIMDIWNVRLIHLEKMTVAATLGFGTQPEMQRGKKSWLSPGEWPA